MITSAIYNTKTYITNIDSKYKIQHSTFCLFQLPFY